MIQSQQQKCLDILASITLQDHNHIEATDLLLMEKVHTASSYYSISKHNHSWLNAMWYTPKSLWMSHGDSIIQVILVTSNKHVKIRLVKLSGMLESNRNVVELGLSNET
jgi:hypothetical protein